LIVELHSLFTKHLVNVTDYSCMVIMLLLMMMRLWFQKSVVSMSFMDKEILCYSSSD